MGSISIEMKALELHAIVMLDIENLKTCFMALLYLMSMYVFRGSL